MRVLVTGATGFVASHLLPALTAAAHEVVALGHDAQRIPSHDGVEPLVVDLREVDADTLPPADAVVHLAQANVPFPDRAPELAAVNAASTVLLVEHARRFGAGFVLASSASVYGPASGASDEDDPPRATDFYAATKIAAERFVAAYVPELPQTTILRLVAPYGPEQRGRLIPRLAERIRAGEPVPLNAQARPRLNPIYVGDVVRTVVRALELEGHRLVNVAGDEVVDVRELATLLGDLLGVEPHFEQTRGEAWDVVARNVRLKRELGIDDLLPLREGLRRTVAAEAIV